MTQGANFEVERNLLPDEPDDRLSRMAGEDDARGAHAPKDLSAVEPQQHSLKQAAAAARRLAADPISSPHAIPDS